MVVIKYGDQNFFRAFGAKVFKFSYYGTEVEQKLRGNTGPSTSF